MIGHNLRFNPELTPPIFPPTLAAWQRKQKAVAGGLPSVVCRPSALLGTRVVYCGKNLEQFANLIFRRLAPGLLKELKERR
jgi:hypothetical protein